MEQVTLGSLQAVCGNHHQEEEEEEEENLNQHDLAPVMWPEAMLSSRSLSLVVEYTQYWNTVNSLQ